MEDRVEVNYSEIETPFVIRSDGLTLWPCFGWTLKDWSDKCGAETKFAFRVHKRISNNNWENESIDRFETQLQHYIQWTRFDSIDCDIHNPFKKYPKKDFWVYSSYSYMKDMFADNRQVMDSVKWSELGLDSNLDSDANNSTLWIGSEGAFTPCHQDSYGYNFVAQISGKKLWILFPPSDGNYLYPTRIPYEESSVFSSVDFDNPNYELHPLFRHTSPHIVELNAGDILYVPHLWWHFVRVIEEDFEKSCISINTWIFNDCFQSSLNESIVRFLTTALFNTYCPSEPSKWLNTNADLFSAEEAVKSIGLVLNKCKSMDQKVESRESSEESKKSSILPLNSYAIDSSTFAKFRKLFDKNFNKKSKLEQTMENNASTESIVNCILHPDVIELIAQKLKHISVNM